MITRTAPAWHASHWQKALANAIRDPAELLEILQLPRDLYPAAEAASRLFPLRVPHSYVSRMEKGNPNDPLLKQILPLDAELKPQSGFSADPVGDLQAMPVPGLLHKYHGRVLLAVTGACGVHCRYCFRRHFPYQEANPAGQDWQQALQYIHNDATIEEVILSGGDPLSLSDQRLAKLIGLLEAIPHLKRLRLHTRQPIVLPERVDRQLLHWLDCCALQKVFVLHSNHANEIDLKVIRAVQQLRDCDVTLLNQSVLLRGVNDTAAALQQLSKTLFHAGILPYYLHQLDRVTGAQHFEVPPARAKQLIAALRASLPGYLVPKLVFEQAGQPAKTPLDH